jgi:hypothetical protein
MSKPRDLVAELRQQHSQLGPCPGPFDILCTRCAAAEEIERLQCRVHNWYEEEAVTNLMLDASQDINSQQYVWYLKLEIEELKTKNAIVKYHIQSLANLLVQIQMDSERLPELSAEIDRQLQNVKENIHGQR